MLVITGAGSGIGRATALLAAQRSLPIALLDRDERDLDATAAHCGHADVVVMPCDIADEHAVGKTFDIIADHGPITGLFANAGVERNAPATSLSLATWEFVARTNFTGTFLTCREALRHFEVSGFGAIVCTSSPAALRGFPSGGNAAYAASKGGVSALARALAIEYAGRGIRINTVVPGAIDTPMLVAEFAPDVREAARMRILGVATEDIPMRRLGDASEIAAAVLWLLSDEASYITGAELACDGGLLAASTNRF